MKKDPSTTYKKTICPLDCPDSCGIVATLASGKIISLKGDPEHPYTNGFICKKMKNYHERIYSNERILYPQKRIAEKGKGVFKRISWDEAWSILVTKLTHIKGKYGGEAILPFMYAGNMGAINRFAGHPFFHKLGTSRLEQTICSAAASAGWKKQCGQLPGSSPEIAADADIIVAWGINIKVTNVHFWQYVRSAHRNGGKLIVIDPYKNSTGKSADIYIPVKPGGDGALALGTIKALLEQGDLNQSESKTRIIGFEKLKKYLQATPWSDFVQQSGLNQQKITEFALLLRKHPKTFFRIGIGLTRNSRAGMAIRAISSLAAILGLFDGKKGSGILLASNAFSGNTEILTHPSLASEDMRKINMVQLGQALNSAEPKIRALLVYNANPLSVVPDASTVRQSLLKEDLFTMVHEQVMTPTARFADLLLPATTSFENRDLYTAYGHFYMGIVDSVIQPQGEALSNFDFFQTLAAKMGYNDPPFHQTIDERISAFVDKLEGLPSDFSLKKHNPGEWIRSTKSSSHSRRSDSDETVIHFSAPGNPDEPDIPCLTPAGEAEDGDLVTRFPFHLITPPHKDLLNSTFGERFRNIRGDVLIHPTDAARHTIIDGDEVILHNFRGRTQRIARVSTDTQVGLLVAEGIYWELPEEQRGINDLTSQKLTDMGKGATFHESRVSLSLATDYRESASNL